MGDVIAFPGTYGRYELHTEEADSPQLVELAEDFLRLRIQQREAEKSSAVLDALPAQCKMSRLSAEMLDIRIDRAVQRLQRAPADPQEARSNIRTLFTLADCRLQEIDVLEEAALYVTNAYWDAGFVSTPEVAPILRGRAAAAQFRHGSANGLPPTVDMVHAVVTQHVAGCTTGSRLQRLRQIERYDLLEYFDHPIDGPDDFPPAA